jgi:hypothetical protein
MGKITHERGKYVERIRHRWMRKRRSDQVETDDHKEQKTRADLVFGKLLRFEGKGEIRRE